MGVFYGGLRKGAKLTTVDIESPEERKKKGGRKLFLGLGAGLGLGHLGSQGLVDFEVRHFEFAEEIEEHGVLFGSEIASGFFAEGIEHINEFVGSFGIDDGLAAARVGVGAENHGGIAADHADKILEGGTFLGGFFGGRGGGIGGRRRGGNHPSGFDFGFALLFLDNVRAEFAFRGEGPAVDDAKSDFGILIRHGG